MKGAAADSCGLGAGRLEAQFLYFFVVILAIEDVPLLAAFEDGALLVLDLLAGRLIDSLLLIQQFLETLANFISIGELDHKLALLYAEGDGSASLPLSGQRPIGLNQRHVFSDVDLIPRPDAEIVADGIVGGHDRVPKP